MRVMLLTPNGKRVADVAPEDVCPVLAAAVKRLQVASVVIVPESTSVGPVSDDEAHTIRMGHTADSVLVVQRRADMSLWWAGPMRAELLQDYACRALEVERPSPPTSSEEAMRAAIIRCRGMSEPNSAMYDKLRIEMMRHIHALCENALDADGGEPTCSSCGMTLADAEKSDGRLCYRSGCFSAMVRHVSATKEDIR